jgi:ATP-dependent Lon protease
VLPVGGVKEKLLAAHRAGMKRGAHPRAQNRRDLDDVPQDVLRELTVTPIRTMAEILPLVLEPPVSRPASTLHDEAEL